jgi:hypothetical protein
LSIAAGLARLGLKSSEGDAVDFMLLFLGRRGAPDATPDGLAAMKAYSGELQSRGKLRVGAPLRPESEAARVVVRGGKPIVTDGPYAESKEVLGGFWIIDVASRDEALEIARRCPHARGGIVEVHPLEFRMAAPDPGQGLPFLYAFRADTRIEDKDRAKLREMLDFTVTLKQEGRFLETAPLAADPPAARIETRSGKTVVTDGPFAEAKEVIGGYALLRAASRDEAVAIAKRYPHPKWGPLELREILFFDPV